MFVGYLIQPLIELLSIATGSVFLPTDMTDRSPAFSSPALLSVLFQSCIFHPLKFLCPSFSCPANSAPPINLLFLKLCCGHTSLIHVKNSTRIKPFPFIDMRQIVEEPVDFHSSTLIQRQVCTTALSLFQNKDHLVFCMFTQLCFRLLCKTKTEPKTTVFSQN